jgi:hypothetical protein
MRVKTNNNGEEAVITGEWEGCNVNNAFMEELFKQYEVSLVSNKYLEELENKVKIADEFMVKLTDLNPENVKVIYAGTKALEKKKKDDEYKNEKIQCECGEMVMRKNMCRHKKSKKHIKRMENL